MHCRVRISVASTALLMLSLAGCGLNSASPAADSLTIYASRPGEITQGVIDDFEQENPQYQGKVKVLTIGAQEVLERVRAESGRPQADVWWGGTAQQFEQGVRDHLLTAPPADVVRRVPAEYRGTDNLWLGEMRMAQVILYNDEMLPAAQAPKDWDDLVTPAYKQEILIRDVPASGTMRSVFSAMIGRFYTKDGNPEAGYQWLRKLDANTKEYTANPTDLYLRIQRQEAPVSIWNLQDVLVQRKKGVPMTPVVPASGAPVLLDGVGKIKGGPNGAAADAFLRFLLKQRTQQQLAEETFQLSTVPLKKKPTWLAELDLKEMPVDWAEVNSRENEWVSYWSDNIKGRG